MKQLESVYGVNIKVCQGEEGKKCITGFAKVDDDQLAYLRAKSGTMGEFYWTTRGGTQQRQAEREQEEEEETITLPTEATLENAIDHKIRLGAVAVGRKVDGRLCLNIRKQDSQRFYVALFGKDKPMKHIWEIQGVPIRFQPEEIVEYMQEKGWNAQKEPGRGTTYKKEGRIYRDIKVRCDKEPESRRYVIQEATITLNRHIPWWEKEEQWKKEKEAEKQEIKFADTIKNKGKGKGKAAGGGKAPAPVKIEETAAEAKKRIYREA